MTSLVRSPLAGPSDTRGTDGLTSALRAAGTTLLTSTGLPRRLPGGPPRQPRRRTWAGAVAKLPGPVLLACDLSVATGLVVALGLPQLLLAAWGLALALTLHSRSQRSGALRSQSRRSGAPGSLREVAADTVRTSLAALALTALSAYFLGLSVARSDLLLGVAVFTLSSLLLNLLPVLARRMLGVTASRAVLVGTAPQVTRLLAELARAGGRRVEVAGLCLTDADLPHTDQAHHDQAHHDQDSLAGVPAGVSVTRGLSSLTPAVRVLGATTVIAVPGEDLGPLELRRLAWEVERLGAQLQVDSGLLDTSGHRTRLVAAGSARLLQVRAASRTSALLGVKDLWERCFAAVLLMLVLPLLGGLVLAVRADRQGPALFRQRRVGLAGKPFTLLKLRTMLPEAEEGAEELAGLNETDGPLFKMRHDPRTTRLGRVLRKYSLDELPQLWNVVRGEMALVGPRPALPGEVAGYAPDTYRRLAVKPGLTGLWQVSGRSDLPWEETERLDLMYVDNWSLALDAAIVARTAKAVIGHQGAY